ncbi:hypothetical protein F5Y14DRAFT_125014 [Nemania sp. NC0429]|nr:hypothetical protein F5Y14DRAFT_125014 [Nemania sp. NC0429]
MIRHDTATTGDRHKPICESTTTTATRRPDYRAIPMPIYRLRARARRPRVVFCVATFLVFLVFSVFYVLPDVPYRSHVVPEPVYVPVHGYAYTHGPEPEPELVTAPVPIPVAAPLRNETADVGVVDPTDAAGNATLGVSFSTPPLSSFLFPLSSFLFPLSSFLFPLSSFLFPYPCLN